MKSKQHCNNYKRDLIRLEEQLPNPPDEEAAPGGFHPRGAVPDAGPRQHQVDGECPGPRYRPLGLKARIAVEW